MDFVIPRIARWTAALAFAIAGCNVDTRIDYEHAPTSKLESDHTLNRPELSPFSVDGVVVAPLFRMITPQSTQVWLKLWTSSGKTVTARAAALCGIGAQAAQCQRFPVEISATTDRTDVKGAQYGLILLGEIGNDALTAMTAAGGAKLSAELRVGAAEEYRMLSFAISRQQSRHWATH